MTTKTDATRTVEPVNAANALVQKYRERIAADAKDAAMYAIITITSFRLDSPDEPASMERLAFHAEGAIVRAIIATFRAEPTEVTNGIRFDGIDDAGQDWIGLAYRFPDGRIWYRVGFCPMPLTSIGS